MAENSAIGWTDHTFNPWMGCRKVSAGCDHCYAETLVTGRMGLPVWGPDAARKRTSVANWRKPLAWNRKAEAEGRRMRVFCGSLMDFAEAHPDAEAARPDLWALVRDTPWLDWLMLTKRPGRLPRVLPEGWDDGWSNVWLGTSVENMEVGYRARHLAAVPAAVRFVSYEPALGPLDELDLTGIHWLIYGGESGPGFRPEGEPGAPKAWARAIRDRCRAEGIAFFHKQSAAFRNETGVALDGEVVHEFPRGRDPLPPPLQANLFAVPSTETPPGSAGTTETGDAA